MWLDAVGPVTACLEKAHEGKLTIPEAIPMLHSALLLMGSASQHHAFLKKKNKYYKSKPVIKEPDDRKQFCRYPTLLVWGGF